MKLPRRSGRRQLARLLGIGFLMLLPELARAQNVVISAPPALRALLERQLGQRRFVLDNPAATAAASAELRQRIAELLASEGYFKPRIEIRATGGELLAEVDAGPRTAVAAVRVGIEGAIDADAAARLRAAWALPVGAPFRQEDWDTAKQALLSALLAADFPEAQLSASAAEIDPESGEATLGVDYRSGPRIVIGEIRYEGFSRYEPALAARFNRSLAPGQPYRQADLLALQQALQQTPYFSSVVVELDTTGLDPGAAVYAAPVVVRVREREPHRVGFGAGYSSNTGARAETTYRSADLFRRGWELQTGVRLEERQQSGFLDLYLPPNADHSRDSFGLGVERSDIQNLLTDKTALGAVRSRRDDRLETRLSLNWIGERQRTPNDAPQLNRALTPNASWTWRGVDDLLQPRRGLVLLGEVGGGARGLLSDQNFLRLHGRGQVYLPLGERDVLSLRGEVGATLAPSRDGIPSDWLFRTGGAQTVRGYAYQSLGVQRDTAVLGGRWLGVASGEATHWLDARWGIAAFVDAGDAADSRADFRFAVGSGLGARWNSPAWPIGVDLAWGFRTRRAQLHFSLAIPF